MSNKHTPGPWHFANKSARSRMLGVYTANGDAVATVAVAGPLTIERRTADARLIAAAPELLEALKLAYRHMNGGNDSLTPMEFAEAFKKVSAAIAKTTI